MTPDWKTVVRRFYRHDRLTAGFFFLILIFFLVCHAFAEDRQIKIGIAPWISNEESDKNIAAFKKRLELVGFIEGKNTVYYQENAQANPDKQAKIIQSFVEKKVDLIYSLTAPGTLIAGKITQDIPIVFSNIVFPVEVGIVKSLSSSENNCVGTRNYISVGKQLEALLMIVPDIRRLGVVHLTADPNSTVQLEQMTEIGKALGIQIVDMNAPNLDTLKELLQTVNADALYLACDALVQDGGEDIVIEKALKDKIPTLSCYSSGIRKGALVGDIVNLVELGTASGKKAVAILNGEKPTDIITETQQGSYVMVNLKTVDALGLPKPYQVLAIASDRKSTRLNSSH